MPFFRKKGAITRRMFRQQRAPRRGDANPERFDVPLWEWLVREGCSAYEATKKFKGPSPIDAGPGWCFERFGCSKTVLEDGRVVYVAGEHEDSYDPDFYIYNDVVVRHPGGEVEIFGYPEELFPPTDFHTATRIGDAIWLVGSLGYMGMRHVGETQVYRLGLGAMAMQRVATSGAMPGWIHKHRARYDAERHAIVVERGVIARGDDGEDFLENVDDWSLDLDSLVWTRLTQRPFEQWSVRRVDGEELMIFELSQAVFQEDHPEFREPAPQLAKFYDSIGEGYEPDSRKVFEAKGRVYERATFEALFSPPLEHEALDIFEDDDEDDEMEREVAPEFAGNDDARLRIGGALVRYEASLGSAEILVKIEGELAADARDALLEDLRRKLTRLQGASVECARKHP